jgi:hypothetical protein
MAYIDVGKFVNFIRNSNMEKQDKNTVLVAMQLQPTADVVEVKHGEWSHLGGDEWYCTNCGVVITTEGSWEKPTKNYCFECGAKMDGTPKERGGEK